ncbi:MAG: hypothetical protein U0457_21280 [Candidatus Sericytochromatia bacterium]
MKTKIFLLFIIATISISTGCNNVNNTSSSTNITNNNCAVKDKNDETDNIQEIEKALNRKYLNSNIKITQVSKILDCNGNYEISANYTNYLKSEQTKNINIKAFRNRSFTLKEDDYKESLNTEKRIIDNIDKIEFSLGAGLSYSIDATLNKNELTFEKITRYNNDKVSKIIKFNNNEFDNIIKIIKDINYQEIPENISIFEPYTISDQNSYSIKIIGKDSNSKEKIINISYYSRIAKQYENLKVIFETINKIIESNL